MSILAFLSHNSLSQSTFISMSPPCHTRTPIALYTAAPKSIVYCSHKSTCTSTSLPPTMFCPPVSSSCVILSIHTFPYCNSLCSSSQHIVIVSPIRLCVPFYSACSFDCSSPQHLTITMTSFFSALLSHYPPHP